MIAAFEPNRLGPEIDTQGAVNEQSTLYEDFVYYLWQHGLPELAACGYRRSVYVSQRPDLVLVFDRAWGSGQYQQLWHLDPALRVTRLGSSYALASAPGTDLLLKQIPLPGQVIPPGSTQVVRGQVRPYQGWVSHQMLQRIPADVVTMTTFAPSAAMLTLIVPAAPGTPTATAISGPPGGPYQLRVRVGAAVASFSITAGGVIS